MNYKREIQKLIANDVLEEEINIPTDSSMGDYCLPCFKLAKTLRKSPFAIAQELSLKIIKPDWVDKIETVGGYLNFFINKQYFAKQVLQDLQIECKPKNGKTICIDYSSINVAKPFHMGHLPSTVIGGSLYRIFTYLGYTVVGINHLGDYGTQFGKLISVYNRVGKEKDIINGGVKELQRLYVQYSDFEKKEPNIIEEARAWSLKIEQGDKEACRLFNLFKDITLKEVKRIYNLLGISFDSYNGESFFIDKVLPVVQELESKDLLEVSEGAKVVDLANYNMPPCLILRGDGASLYATRDIAAAMYRKETYNFSKCLYVVAYQQNLHFKQVFKVIELMGHEWAKDLEHIAFGMVSLESGTLSSRTGNVVYLADVLDSAVQSAKAIICEKKFRNDIDVEKVAKSIGIGAVVFSALSSAKIKDVNFSMEKVLSFEGETGPYLQYTHSRCCSLLAKAKAQGITLYSQNEHTLDSMSSLISVESFELIKELNNFENTVYEAAEKYEPCIVTKYLLNLASKFNKYYFEHKILDTDINESAVRLSLVEKVQKVLSRGLNLILIDAVEAM